MPRVVLADIQAIADLDSDIVPNEAALLAFSEVANALVTELCTGTAGPATAYTTDRLTKIEAWLTAHFYHSRDPQANSEWAGDVKKAAMWTTQLGFDNTLYGQNAMRLDTNGALARLNKKILNATPKIGGFWAGTEAT